jgi:hypothetical protein
VFVQQVEELLAWHLMVLHTTTPPRERNTGGTLVATAPTVLLSPVHEATPAANTEVLVGPPTRPHVVVLLLLQTHDTNHTLQELPTVAATDA